jgi:hypothetical protein
VDGPTSIDDLIAQIEHGVHVPREDGREVLVRGILVKRTVPAESDVPRAELYPTKLRRGWFGPGPKTSPD